MDGCSHQVRLGYRLDVIWTNAAGESPFFDRRRVDRPYCPPAFPSLSCTERRPAGSSAVLGDKQTRQLINIRPLAIFGCRPDF